MARPITLKKFLKQIIKINNIFPFKISFKNNDNKTEFIWIKKASDINFGPYFLKSTISKLSGAEGHLAITIELPSEEGDIKII